MQDQRNTLQNITNYQKSYSNEYNFEKYLVKYRMMQLKDLILEIQPRNIIEIGCGIDLLSTYISKYYDDYSQWLIIEPAPEFASKATCAQTNKLCVINDFFENCISEIMSKFNSDIDLVICSSLLHELPDISSMLSSIYKISSCSTKIIFTLPNAGSLHRRIAVEMGLIDNVFEISDRGILMQQNHVFNLSTFSKYLIGSNFKVINSGGYFIKPFSHTQMDSITEHLGIEVLDGLNLMGRRLPDLACEFWILASRN